MLVTLHQGLQLVLHKELELLTLNMIIFSVFIDVDVGDIQYGCGKFWENFVEYCLSHITLLRI